MNEELKSLLQELGHAINESLSDSERIAAAIGEIRRAGYDTFLLLEATIGFSKREPEAMDDGETTIQTNMTANDEGAARSDQKPTAPPEIRWTTQDQKFIKALKIGADDQQK